MSGDLTPREAQLLAAAFAARERPATPGFEDRVLDALGQDGRARRPATPWRWRPIGVGLTGAVTLVLIGVVAWVTIGPRLLSQDRPGELTTRQLSARMLAAYQSAGDQILYTDGSGTLNGNPSGAPVEEWVSPWQGGPGQQVEVHSSYSGQGQDLYLSFTVPSTGYPTGKGGIEGTITGVNHQARTWWTQTGAIDSVPNNGILPPSTLQQQIAAGQWRVDGTTTLDGRSAIHLTQSESSGDLTNQVWVDAATYLPIRSVITSAYTPESGSPGTVTTTTGYEFLAPTSANEAQLQVVVPPGYAQTAPPPPGS